MSNYVIETRNLTKQYGVQKSVSDLNIHVQKGRIYGLLGRNGAGKTTTMKLLLGLTEPTAGEVEIFGHNIKKNEKKLLPRIGSLIESPGFYPNLTATENLHIFAKLRGIPKRDAIKNALEVVGLPYNDKKLFSQYSLGMKQRLAIALAIMHDPELLILDEPINGLDPIGIAEVRKFIRNLCNEHGKTILISSHILSEISLLADDIGIIDHGILLEEESLAELEEKNSKYIHFSVSDAAQAARILEAQFHLNNFKITDDYNILLYDTEVSVAAINRTFVQNKIDVTESHLCEDTLEDYFKKVTGVKGLLDLISCEFAKIKRQKFILISVLGACLFPIPATMLIAKDNLLFEQLFKLVINFGYFLLLPMVLSIVSSQLFFMERENDILKNLATVPVPKGKLALAKLAVLLVISLLYSVAGLGATIIGGLAVGTVEGIGAKLWMSLTFGVMFFVATLPVVVLIVYFNRSYVFSIILSFAYAIFNFGLSLNLINFEPSNPLLSVLPAPIIMRWWMASWADPTGEYAALRQPYLLSTTACVGILCLIAIIAALLICNIYKRQEN